MTPALVLERKDQPDGTRVVGPAALPPTLDADYWAYRVRLTDHQAVIGFPKFGTIGIGFAVEHHSTNTNLPYRLPAGQIADHIACNKGGDQILDEDVVRAVQMIREACVEDNAPTPQGPVTETPVTYMIRQVTL